MLKIKELTFNNPSFPAKLRDIFSPPKQLFYIGDSLEKMLSMPALAVVGSRKVSLYGKAVTSSLIEEIARQNIVIISGLALGVDALAHEAALDAGGRTIAVMPCGLDRIYPSSNRQLAMRILEHGGALVSEYPEDTDARRENFIARNRLVSGLSDGVLITEAAEKSGTLHTANFALEQGREVMAVPGNINSSLSKGTNNLIKVGAHPVTEATDVLHVLKIEPLRPKQQELLAANEQEHIILQLLKENITDGDSLLVNSKLEPAVFNQTLTMLEITGKIKATGNGQWMLA
jgi:DNA processing protein